MTFRPSPDSLAAQVLSYFALHPEEVLRVEDIAAKFLNLADSRNVHVQLVAACDHDMLVWDHGSFGGVYTKGPVDLPSVLPDAPLRSRPHAVDRESDHLQGLLVPVAEGAKSDPASDPMARGAALVLVSVEQARGAPAGQGHLNLATGLSGRAWEELDLMPPDDRALFISGLITQLCAAVPLDACRPTADQQEEHQPAGGIGT